MGLRKKMPPRLDFSVCIAQLKEAGFETLDQPGGRVEIRKHGCAAVLEKGPAGEPQFAVRPGLLGADGIAQLLDRGFQKFWQQGNRTFPALAEQLQAVHRFAQDLKAVAGQTSLYNEALGTVSSRYLYDRLEGREGPRRHKPFG